MTGSALITLCYLHDIANGGSKGFEVEGRSLFAVRRQQSVHLYLNRCPHAGLPLNWVPDQFLDADRELIQCSSHGALFQIETGRCVAGPCPGRFLQTVPFELENGKLSIARGVLDSL